MSSLVKIKQIEGLSQILFSKPDTSQVLLKSNNLSDLPSVNSARSNLNVYSRPEVDALVGNGNAYNVQTIAFRNELSGLRVADRVFVLDDGDGKWALYIVTAVTDGMGVSSTYVKVADQDLFVNAMTAAAVKSSYESNPNTNAFTDDEKAKLSLIGINSYIYLDEVWATAQQAAGAAQTADYKATLAGTAASNALAVAQAKMNPFVEFKESFSGLAANATDDVQITLANPVHPSFTPKVFCNAILVESVVHNPNSPLLTFQVPYPLEFADQITVYYMVG